MLRLHDRIQTRWDAEPSVARITTNSKRPEATKEHEALLTQGLVSDLPQGFRAYLSVGKEQEQTLEPAVQFPPLIRLPSSLGYLSDGDIVRVDPRLGEITVLYRRNSPCNAMLVTERCNNDCIMCSQPPRNVDDSFLVKTWLEAIPLMDPSTTELVITGGEPSDMSHK